MVVVEISRNDVKEFIKTILDQTLTNEGNTTNIIIETNSQQVNSQTLTDGMGGNLINSSLK